jgi:hypothetical protein
VRDDITDINATICNPNWRTGAIRPPQGETDSLKTIAMHAYGIPPNQRPRVELDHLIPLELLGSDDITNLSPEVSDIPNARPPFRNTKDGVEGRLHAAVCAHQVTLAAAQWAIAVNWVTAEANLGLHTR